MKPHFHLLAASAVVTGLVTSSTPAARAEKLFDYSFDGSEMSEPSGRGARESLGFNFYTRDGMPGDLRSAGGTGVSGKPWDRAFDGTTANDMGKGQTDATVNLGPVAIAETETSALSSLISYTISGWMKSDDMLNLAARIVSCGFVTSNKPLLEARAAGLPGAITFEVNPTPQSEVAKRMNSLSAAYATTGEWVFFAITYSAVGDKAQTLEFFQGTKTNTVARVGISTFDGKTAAEPGLLFIGNLKNRQRPFKGLLDNIRIYGSTTDASGALTIPQLEELRVKDIAGVPGAK